MKKSSLIIASLSCAMISLTTAATIVTYDFENYADGSTGEGNPLTTSSGPRVYNANSSLPAGVTSVSAISFSVSDPSAADQNQVDFNLASDRFRWRLTGPVVTASFSVTIAAGFQLENFNMSLVQTGNAAGSFEVAYDGNTMGPSGVLDSDDTLDGDDDAYSTNTIASAVSGTVNFVITVNPTALSRTSRWDDIQLNADIVAVPEPSSSVLFGLGGLALLFRRRK